MLIKKVYPKKSRAKVCNEPKLDSILYADEINFCMDLYTFPYINCASLYPTKEQHNFFISACRASETLAQKNFDLVINKAKDFRKELYLFVNNTPEDTITYRNQIADFIKNSPFKVTSILYKIDFKNCIFSNLLQAFTYILEIRLRLEDIFLDNNVF